MFPPGRTRKKSTPIKKKEGRKEVLGFPPPPQNAKSNPFSLLWIRETEDFLTLIDDDSSENFNNPLLLLSLTLFFPGGKLGRRIEGFLSLLPLY